MKCKLITTVSDTSHPGYQMLVKSLEKFEWDWEVCGTEYQAFGSKMVNAYEYAKQTDCTHLFIVDAYDVVVLSNMQEALDKIPDKDIILFNSERNSWPFDQWGVLYPECKSSFKFLNGGMAFVNVKRFIQMFEENPIRHDQNDQVELAKTFLTKGYLYNFKLDTDCEVFQTLCGTNFPEFEFNGGRITNKETGTQPCFVHGNGQAPMAPIYNLI